METTYAIIIIIAVVVIVFVSGKVLSASNKAINQKVLFRSGHKEGEQLVKQPVTIQAAMSMDYIMSQLASRVTVAGNKLGLKSVLYVSSLSENRITYAYGNSFEPKIFEASVALTENGGVTTGVFQMLTWTEANGMVAKQDAMRRLRQQVQAVFAAACAIQLQGTSATLPENTKRFCAKCGTNVMPGYVFCKRCGAAVK